MRHLLLLMLLLSGACGLWAQDKGGGDDEARRVSWRSEMRQYKRSYFAKELDLSKDQQKEFFPLYEEMEDATEKENAEARTMTERIASLKEATDTEYLKAAEAQYDARVDQAQTERAFMDKFAKILTPRQLFRLPDVERGFARDIMRHHQRLRKGDGRKNK